jgi:hypothetical protein
MKNFLTVKMVNMSEIELTCPALLHLFMLWRWALPQGKLLLYFWITSTNLGFLSFYGLTKEVTVIVKLILQGLALRKMVLFVVILQQKEHKVGIIWLYV